MTAINENVMQVNKAIVDYSNQLLSHARKKAGDHIPTLKEVWNVGTLTSDYFSWTNLAFYQPDELISKIQKTQFFDWDMKPIPPNSRIYIFDQWCQTSILVFNKPEGNEVYYTIATGEHNYLTVVSTVPGFKPIHSGVEGSMQRLAILLDFGYDPITDMVYVPLEHPKSS